MVTVMTDVWTMSIAQSLKKKTAKYKQVDSYCLVTMVENI